MSDGFLNNLYVLPDCQGRGIGGALLSEVKAHAPEGVKLWTFEPNEGAIRFYERHGFVTIERSDGRANELLSKVVYGLIMRRRDPGVLHLRI